MGSGVLIFDPKLKIDGIKLNISKWRSTASTQFLGIQKLQVYI